MNDATNSLCKTNQTEIMPVQTRVILDIDTHYQRIQALNKKLPVDTLYGLSIIKYGGVVTPST
jgi:hypothetical protein